MSRRFSRNAVLISVISLAWPTMLEQLMQTAVQYIDTAMVGTLGRDAIAAVGSTTTVNWLVLSSVSALGIGFLSYISRALGAKNQDSAKRASAQSVLVVLMVGVLFTILTLSLSAYVPVWMKVDEGIRNLASRYFFILYASMLPRVAITIFGTVLRSAGDSKTPMITGIVVNLINVILNFLFIYPERTLKVLSFEVRMWGAGLGVEGAALASSVAFFVGALLITVVLYRHKTISPKGQTLLPDKEILAPCLRVALPNMAQRFATSLGYVAFASMINSLGEISTAAHTVANTVESAFYIPGYGMQAAAATLAGNALGAEDREGLKTLCRIITAVEVVLMVISGGLLLIFAPWMVSLFTNDMAVAAMTVTVLRLVALSEPFYGVSIVLEGMLQGMGKTLFPFIVNVIGMWIVRIGGTYICINMLLKGLVAAWGCMIAHNLLLFLMFCIYWLRILKKQSSSENLRLNKEKGL